MIIINFKNYPGAFGQGSVGLAKQVEEASLNFSELEVILAVPLVDIFRISSQIDIPVFSQHVDPFPPGQTTGFAIPQAVKEAGAEGTLINHSENPMDLDMIRGSVESCKDVGLVSVVCADSPATVGQVKRFSPDYVAYEPPELIGGDVSVVEAESFVVSDAVESASPTPLLVGAGVNSAEDISRGLELGARGVLVSSSIVKAKDPAEAFKGIAQGFFSK